jgi:hypothetical protein
MKRSCPLHDNDTHRDPPCKHHRPAALLNSDMLEHQAKSSKSGHAPVDLQGTTKNSLLPTKGQDETQIKNDITKQKIDEIVKYLEPIATAANSLLASNCTTQDKSKVISCLYDSVQTYLSRNDINMSSLHLDFVRDLSTENFSADTIMNAETLHRRCLPLPELNKVRIGEEYRGRSLTNPLPLPFLQEDKCNVATMNNGNQENHVIQQTPTLTEKMISELRQRADYLDNLKLIEPTNDVSRIREHEQALLLNDINAIRQKLLDEICQSMQFDTSVVSIPHQRVYAEPGTIRPTVCAMNNDDTTQVATVDPATPVATADDRLPCVGEDVCCDQAAAKKIAFRQNHHSAKLSSLDEADILQEEPKPNVPITKVTPSISVTELIKDGYFTKFHHVGLVEDSFLVSLALMRPCEITKDDRVGRYRQLPLGFIGFCCKYCIGHPGFGRYFPASFKKFLKGKLNVSMVTHFKDNCQFCPSHIRDKITELAKQDAERKETEDRRPKGSRKKLYSFVWKKLESAQPDDLYTQAKLDEMMDSSTQDNNDSNADINHEICETTTIRSDLDDEHIWSMILSDCQLVTRKERHYVADTLFASLAQLCPVQFQENDRAGRTELPVGYTGVCCKHCKGKSGYGRFFPKNLNSLALVETGNQFIMHMTEKCTMIPHEIRNAIIDFQISDQTRRVKRYGSRKTLFRRIWFRLHKLDADTESEIVARCRDEDVTATSCDPIDWEAIVSTPGGLVTMADFGAVSNDQFLALSQMKICYLSEVDKSSWYKDREIGYAGITCCHCNGQLGSGRFFPKTVKSLSQTSSSHVLIRHFTDCCLACPEEIRSIITRLHRDAIVLDGRVNMDAYCHGSRIKFYKRLWDRMHVTGDP